MPRRVLPRSCLALCLCSLSYVAMSSPRGIHTCGVAATSHRSCSSDSSSRSSPGLLLVVVVVLLLVLPLLLFLLLLLLLLRRRRAPLLLTSIVAVAVGGLFYVLLLPPLVEFDSSSRSLARRPPPRRPPRRPSPPPPPPPPPRSSPSHVDRRGRGRGRRRRRIPIMKFKNSAAQTICPSSGSSSLMNEFAARKTSTPGPHYEVQIFGGADEPSLIVCRTSHLANYDRLSFSDPRHVILSASSGRLPSKFIQVCLPRNS